MKKKRKKKAVCPGGLPPGSRPTPSAVSPRPRCRHRLEFTGPGSAPGPSLTSTLNRTHPRIYDLDILHESSFLCLDILAHSCCDLEVHVEELNTLRLRIFAPAPRAHRCGPFLQVSPLIPHRQGFRAH